MRSLTRSAQIGYHVAEAEAWLDASNNGANTTPLAYAGFELRLEIERVAFELLRHVRGDDFDEADLSSLRGFERIRKRIVELEGRHVEISRKVALANLLLEGLDVPQRIQRIDLGRLHRDWMTCSEVCHVGWSLAANNASPSGLPAQVFRELRQIQEWVRGIVDRGITWARVNDPAFEAMQARYVRGEVSDGEVRAWFKARGLWATLSVPGEDPVVVGVPIAPEAG